MLEKEPVFGAAAASDTRARARKVWNQGKVVGVVLVKLIVFYIIGQ